MSHALSPMFSVKVPHFMHTLKQLTHGVVRKRTCQLSWSRCSVRYQTCNLSNFSCLLHCTASVYNRESSVTLLSLPCIQLCRGGMGICKRAHAYKRSCTVHHAYIITLTGPPGPLNSSCLVAIFAGLRGGAPCTWALPYMCVTTSRSASWKQSWNAITIELT